VLLIQHVQGSLETSVLDIVGNSEHFTIGKL